MYNYTIYSNSNTFVNNNRNEILDYKISTRNNLLVKGNNCDVNNVNDVNNNNNYQLTKKFNFETNQFNSHFEETILKKPEKNIQEQKRIHKNYKENNKENYKENNYIINNNNNNNYINQNLDEENSENLWNIIKENEVRKE
jgi:hypothetical protein